MLSRAFSLSLVLSCILSAGCAKEEAQKSAPSNGHPKEAAISTAIGEQPFEGGGYTCGFSKDWIVLDLAKGTPEELEKKIKSMPNADRCRQMLNAAKSNKMLKMVALNLKLITDGFATNMNVLEIDLPKDVSVEQCFSANTEQVKKMDSSFHSERSKIDSVECLKLSWSSKGADSLSYVTLVAFREGKQIVFTGTTTKGMASQAETEFNKVISTIHFKA